MKEYKVEYIAVKKEYWRYVVEAENRSAAIEKVRKAGLDVTTAEDQEVASQCNWTASSDQGFLGWVSSIFKG